MLVNQVTKSLGNAYVGSNDVEAGRLAMEAVARKLNGKQSYRSIGLAFRRNSPRIKALEKLAQINNQLVSEILAHR